jgi:hypothetical protein
VTNSLSSDGLLDKQTDKVTDNNMQLDWLQDASAIKLTRPASNTSGLSSRTSKVSKAAPLRRPRPVYNPHPPGETHVAGRVWMSR